MAQKTSRLDTNDLVLDYSPLVFIPYKRCRDKYAPEGRDLEIPKFRELGVTAKLNIGLEPDLYGVLPRIFLLWIFKQIKQRQYLPAAMAKEIPLIPFDLYAASLELLDGISGKARQEGMLEFLQALQNFTCNFRFISQGKMGRSANVVSHFNYGVKKLRKAADFLEDESKDDLLDVLGPGESVLKSPSYMEITHEIFDYAVKLSNSPDTELIRKLSASPLALDIYGDMLHRGLNIDEWAAASNNEQNLWLDWPGKDPVGEEELLSAIQLVKHSSDERLP